MLRRPDHGTTPWMPCQVSQAGGDHQVANSRAHSLSFQHGPQQLLPGAQAALFKALQHARCNIGTEAANHPALSSKDFHLQFPPIQTAIAVQEIFLPPGKFCSSPPPGTTSSGSTHYSRCGHPVRVLKNCTTSRYHPAVATSRTSTARRTPQATMGVRPEGVAN